MPYIPKETRKIVASAVADTKGELNYLVSQEALGYIRNKGVSYSVISDAIAALNDAAEELRRRLLNPYEDYAIFKNGDIKEYQELIKEIKEKYNASSK